MPIAFTGRAFTIRIEPIVDGAVGPVEWIASFGTVAVTGDTIEDAVGLLKEQMIAAYKRLRLRTAAQLGSIPQRQLAKLQRILED